MELRSMNCTAEELNSGNISKITVTPPQFINCTVEEALGKKFLNVLTQQQETALKPSGSGSGRVSHCRNVDRKKVSLKLFTVYSVVESPSSF